MKNEEALNVINSLIRQFTRLEQPTAVEGLKIAKEALEKQIPTKPLRVPYEESRLRTYKCPNCCSYELRFHCDICGQRLDWGMKMRDD